MKKETVIQELKNKFSSDIVEIWDKSAKRVYIEIVPESLIRVSSHLFKDLACRFNIATGIDCRSHIEILYHYNLEDINLIITLRVKLNRAKPEINSLAVLFEGANWIERELNEMLGISFKGHPDMRRLLLDEGWPQDVFPLRYDYKEWDQEAIRDRGAQDDE